jgi:hypothetical protein
LLVELALAELVWAICWLSELFKKFWLVRSGVSHTTQNFPKSKAVLDDPGTDLCARAESEFGEDVPHVGVHRPLGDH